MRFIANPYEVEILEGSKKSLLKINDATGTFRSIELDELSDETVKALNEYNETVVRVSEIVKSEKIEEEDKKILEKFDKVTKKIKQLNLKFIKINVRDWESNVDLIDNVRGEDREHFFSAIKRASLGVADVREQSKKKLQSIKSNGRYKKQNSKNKDSVKKK